MSAQEADKERERVRTTEEMVTRAIQERKKALAEMALETLEEIAPSHPRLAEYRLWVKDLGEELALQERIDGVLDAGREALRADDLDTARRHLESLRKLAPYASSVDDFAAVVEAAAHGQAASADIDRLKHEIEEALEAERPETAREILGRLEATDVPRVTVQTLSRRIDETSRRLREAAEADALVIRFERSLQTHDWHGAREIAHQFGERFPTDDRPAAFFNRVAELEAAERRRQSLQQGLDQLETFLVQGRKAEAELALRLLEKDLDAAKLTELRARLADL